jgi:6,7-dimethyl-8-ribityllumazine synthase
MSSKKKNLSQHNSDEVPSAKNMKFGLVVSEWNQNITFALRDGCIDSLKENGAMEEDIQTIYVPGAFELPSAAKMLLVKENPDAVICIGCVIKGETKHDDYINNAVATGIMHLGLVSGKPVIFSVLTPNDMDQAKDRAGGKYGNKGVEAAVSAIKMIALAKNLKSSKKSIGF